jgi:hypothetical protein
VLTQEQKQENSHSVKATKWLFLLVRPTGFEPVTYGLEVSYLASTFAGKNKKNKESSFFQVEPNFSATRVLHKQKTG